MTSTSRRNFILGVLVPLTLTACPKTSPFEQVAHQFMEAYYVKMDMPSAEKVTAGLAHDKLAGQIQLLEGQQIGQGTNVPAVELRLASKQSESPDEATFIYEVAPKVADVGKRKVFVKLRNEGGVWKVTQFSEGDQ